MPNGENSDAMENQREATDEDLYSELGMEAWLKVLKAWPQGRNQRNYLKTIMADTREKREEIWQAVEFGRDGDRIKRALNAAGYQRGRDYSTPSGGSSVATEKQQDPDQQAQRLTTRDIVNSSKPPPKRKPYTTDRVMNWSEFKELFNRLALNCPPPGRGRERQDRLEAIAEAYWHHMQNVTPANFSLGVDAWLKNPSPYMPKLGEFRESMLDVIPRPAPAPLPHPKRDEEADERWVREVEAMLGMGKDSCMEGQKCGTLGSVASLPENVATALSPAGSAGPDGDQN